MTNTNFGDDFPELRRRFGTPTRTAPVTVDHKAEAEDILGMYASPENDPHGAALAHATLALVEQQRVANLIAYWQLHTPRSAKESYDHKVIEVSTLGFEDIDAPIREGLGL